MEKLKQTVLDKQQILAEICRRHGKDTLAAYANAWPVPAAKIDPVFTDAFRSLLAESYGPETADAVLEQFGRQPLVSTIDHHGILNHPFFIDSNLIFSLRQAQRYLICLSTAGVSLNNSSWPACLVLTGQDGRLKRFSFFPDKDKTKIVLAAQAINEACVKTVLARIEKDPDLEAEGKIILQDSVNRLFLQNSLLSLPDFSRQASEMSAALWQVIFPQAPQIIYVPVEKLAARIILDAAGQGGADILRRLLFTPSGHDLVEKYFAGNLGAFSSVHKGSFLFWGVDTHGRRVHLRRQGLRIKDERSLIDCELSASGIADGLLTKKLYPTSLVCFLILLYYRVTCLGGFNQVNWLTNIKNKFTRLLRELGEDSFAGTVSLIPADNFAEGNLAFLPANGRPVKATGIDILLAQDNRLYDAYRRLGGLMTVRESIDAQLPEIYKVITPAPERDPALLEISEADIVNQNGLGQKIFDTLKA